MNIYQITLESADQQRVSEISAARYGTNRTHGVKDRSVCGSADLDLNGLGGEFAFCRLYEIEPDITVGPRSSVNGTAHGNCILNGKRVDVMTTVRATGRLLAPAWKARSCDYYVLMTGSFPTYECRGFMPASELLQPERLKDLGYGPTYVATQSELIFTKAQAERRYA